ncbi:MAG: hypothetical protein ACPH86_05410, partial [Schleiferiaceae bacterium]
MKDSLVHDIFDVARPLGTTASNNVSKSHEPSTLPGFAWLDSAINHFNNAAFCSNFLLAMAVQCLCNAIPII